MSFDFNRSLSHEGRFVTATINPREHGRDTEYHPSKEERKEERETASSLTATRKTSVILESVEVSSVERDSRLDSILTKYPSFFIAQTRRSHVSLNVGVGTKLPPQTASRKATNDSFTFLTTLVSGVTFSVELSVCSNFYTFLNRGRHSPRKRSRKESILSGWRDSTVLPDITALSDLSKSSISPDKKERCLKTLSEDPGSRRSSTI
tara:strand:+ start:439 stop:1059 length:621 start_codon:yes stop_codon:yes gene_type:complete